MALADFFVGTEEMDRVARASLRAVEETFHPHHGGMHKACRLKRRLDGRQVAATDEDADILRVADGGPIDTRSPGGDRIAAGDGVGNTGFSGGGGGFLHGDAAQKSGPRDLSRGPPLIDRMFHRLTSPLQQSVTAPGGSGG